MTIGAIALRHPPVKAFISTKLSSGSGYKASKPQMAETPAQSAATSGSA